MSNVESERKIKMNALEIKGKVNTALCYAKVVEDEAIEQIRRMCDYAMTEGSQIRIMPDVHAGTLNQSTDYSPSLSAYTSVYYF